MVDAEILILLQKCRYCFREEPTNVRRIKWPRRVMCLAFDQQNFATAGALSNDVNLAREIGLKRYADTHLDILPGLGSHDQGS